MKLFLQFLGFLALAAACEGEEGPTGDPGSAYFPLQKGLYHIYSVHEIHHSSGAEPLVLNYQLKTAVVDSFASASGQYTYVLHRYHRLDDGGVWEPLDTWSLRKDHREVIVSEGNTPFVKIRFPVTGSMRWNGNALNTMAEDEYAFTDLHEPWQVEGMNFEKTVTVEQERNEDLIVFRDERREVYAREVGLVYKEIIQLHYCTDDACLGQQKIDEGIEMTVSIKEYGRL